MTAFRDADLAFVRSHFPALSSDWAFFDNAGGSVPVNGVTARVTGYMERLGFQVGATYAGSATATRLVHDGHVAAANLVGADVDEVYLGSSSTACVRILSQALRPMFVPGDEVVVTDLDHHANVGPWMELQREGVKIREWRFDRDTHALTAGGLEAVLSKRTKLVAFTHVSNIVGTVHDAAGLVKRIHEAGALACVDGVAFAPHRAVDVRAIGADFYFLSLYKVFGPHIGMMYAKRGLLNRCHWPHEKRTHGPPFEFDPGSVSHELAAAVPGIIEYLWGLDERLNPGLPLSLAGRLARVFSAIERHESALAAPVLELLRKKSSVRVLGRPGADRAPTISFTVEGLDSSSIPPHMDARRVAIRFGDFCACRATEVMGITACNGVVRASMAHYNSPADVERLIEGLKAVI